MRLFTSHRSRADHVWAESPWGEGHASPEDRAFGFELELLELHRRRGEVLDGTASAEALDLEIDTVRRQLAEVAVLPDLSAVA